MKYIATQGERLDSIFFKHYGMEFDQKIYDEFMMKNHHLLLKDTLDSGDEVLIKPIAIQELSVAEGLYGIDI
ncbi:phage tail protein [Helicobacter sp. 13S00477-4]|uniref:phage tail protein n=1 Tax=Helicobacter sp. 13S00477-4 TaxID=1905759 RepID=UPI000BA5B753|nr:phage tail protein [Helicobacter sp. 13S00477-4]PAF50870.1 hypothetical protein BKH44_06900 [Helicobacter sp. 13S00477-4]